MLIMLKGIPSILSPELLKVLMEMGHGDEIVLADGNFPAASHANRLLRSDGHGVPELLKAVLSLFPLDTYGEQPVSLMAVVPGDPVETPIWGAYESIIGEHVTPAIAYVERFAFYERAKKAYAIVATSEKALYANAILRKGVVVE
jgi:L-fucose mutarotase